MKRALIGFAVIAVIVLGVWYWIGYSLLGEPKLRVNLSSPPPNEVTLGDTFEMTIEIINEGGGELKDVIIRLEMPEGFKSSVTGTNTRTIGPYSLSAHDGFGQGFTVIVSDDTPLGNYSLSIVVTADNVSPHILSPEVKVVRD